MRHMSIALQQAMDSLEHAHTSLAHSRQERTQLVTAALRALAHQRHHLLKVLEDSIQQDSSDPTSPAQRLTTAASHELTVVPLGTAALRVHPILHGSASLPELPAMAAAIAAIAARTSGKPQFKCLAADSYGGAGGSAVGYGYVSHSNPCSPTRRTVPLPLPTVFEPSTASGGVTSSNWVGASGDDVSVERACVHASARGDLFVDATRGPPTTPATLRITPEGQTRHLPGVRHSPHRVPHVYPYIESPLRDGEARMHAIASLQRPGVLPSDLEGHVQRWAESAPWEPTTAPNQLSFVSTRELIGGEKKAAERARANAINAARQAAVSCAEAKEKVQLPAQRSP
jgi:hypothetical protein